MRRWVLCSLIVFLLPALSVLPAHSASQVQLTTSTAADQHPTWTTDGQYILFESNRDGGWHIYRIPAAGGTVEQLTFGPLDQIHPEVSPDGSVFVYAEGDADYNGLVDESSLMTMPVTGGTATPILANDGHPNTNPTWSADGTVIYFDTKWGTDYNISRVPASGGTAELVVDRGTDARVCVSPDGLHLSYLQNLPVIYNVVEAALSAPNDYTQITFEYYNTSPEDYSPDGTKILISSRKVLNRLDLYELERSSGLLTRLTFDAESFSYDARNQFAAYSPDGALIAYTSKRISGDENVWVLDPSGVQPPPDVTLSVADAHGLPGGGRVKVELVLDSDTAAEALEFILTDTPEHLTVDSVAAVGHAAGMTAAFMDDGAVHAVLYGPSGQIITAGSGPILEIFVTVDPLAVLGDSTHLELSGAVMPDLNGEALTVALEDGVFRFLRLPGDINGDNLVDVGDLVRLVEIIVGAGDPPTPDELAEADCNGDQNIDALDISCMLDAILSAGAAPGIHTLAAAEGIVDLFVETHGEVRGLQLRFDGTVSTDMAGGGFAPLTPYWGRAADGSVLALAFDPFGRGWEAGASAELTLPAAPVAVRAYGPGGRSLPVTLKGRELEIGTSVSPGLRILAGMPNPFRGATRIRFTLDRAADLEVQVFDLRGALVSSFTEKVAGPGEHAVVWDPRDARGGSLPVGVYFARLRAGDLSGTARLVYLGR